MENTLAAYPTDEVYYRHGTQNRCHLRDQLDADLKFFVLDGDFRHLDKTYINMCIPCGEVDEEDEAAVAEADKKQAEMDAKQEELNNIVYDDKTGATKVTMLDTFPIADVQSGADVIVAGFLP